MNKNDCLNIIKGHKLLKVEKTITNNVITLLIQLGDKIMKQSQFDILFNMLNEFKNDINQLNSKMDAGFKEVRDEMKDIKQDVSELKSDMKEVKTILKKHDDLFVKHGWLSKPSF